MAVAVIAAGMIVAAFAVTLWTSDIHLHLRGATASEQPAYTIVFTQLENFHTQIFTMESNGRNLRQITAEDANTTQVSWSADGKQLVFVNDIDGHEQIYRIDATGTHEIRLTNDNLRDLMPSWSPSGEEIAYLGMEGTSASIWIMNSDGTRPHKVYDPSTTGSNVSGPLVWSPDGRRIAFAGGSADQMSIMLLAPDDGEVTQLTNLPGYATSPAWSPDGRSLVFAVAATKRPTSQSVLYTVRADGTGLSRITSGEVRDSRPAWSPDGTRIAFVRTSGRLSDLFVVNADGTNPRKLSTAPADQMYDFPSWTPEADKILFVRRGFPNSIGGSAALETIDAGGDHRHTLSTTLAPDSSPLIRPSRP